MKFKPYPKYKASGVEWLGDVPEGWTSTKLKHKTPFSTGWTPPTGDSASYLGENLWANISDLGEKIIHETSKRISDDAVKKANIVISCTGSLLFSFKLSIGQVSFVGNDMYTNEAIATFPQGKGIDVSYAYYAYPLFLVQNASENIYGAKLLNQSLINNADVVIPALAEQSAIASFLDRETAKIDTLITKQEKLIDLLKEKRQAVISQAVTKGLDPSVPMKPSGVEWLGDVPVHWKTGALRRVAIRIVVGIAEAATHAYSDVGIPILRATNIRAGKIIGNILRVSAEYSEGRDSKTMQAGDLVTVRTGNAGVTAVIPLELNGSQCFTMLITTLDKYCDSKFYCYYMNSDIARAYFSLEGWGTAQINISVPILQNLPIPIPPIEEQQTIVTYLEKTTDKIDTLIAKAQQAIALQKEHRTALISAAVTGKIDVREASFQIKKAA